MISDPAQDIRSPVATLFRNFAWDETSLGPIETWPAALRGAVDIVLHTKHPMFVCWRPDLRIIFNDGFAEILGPRSEAAFATPLRELWSTVWDRFGGFVEEALAGRSIWAEDVPFLTWRSDYREHGYFSFSYAPLHADDEVGGLLCVCTETTEKVLASRRLADERDRLHDLFEQSPSFIAISRGPEHVYEFVNGAFEELVGRSRGQLLGRRISEVYPDLVRAGIETIMDEVYRTGTPFSARAVRINLHEDYANPALERVINWVAHPYRDADGAIIGLFSEGFDITDQKRAEEDVRRLTSELIHVSRVSAMGTMASALAHELNQPLATVTNYAAAAEMLLARGHDGGDERLTEVIQAIKAASLRAGDIIRRLRSMIERRASHSDCVPLKRVIRQAVDLALMSFHGDQPDIRVSVPARIEVAGDAIQIQQVILNLVRNAAEAMRGREVRRLSVDANASDSMASIRVSDSGHGIAEDVLDKLFEPFHTTKEQGLGVGLSISRTIVEAHGGTISAQNRPEGGCSICFTLPLWSRAASPSPGAAEA